MVPFVTLEPVRINDWIVKASILDDQILIFFVNFHKMQSYIRVFYDEETAHNFIEKLHKVS